MGVYILIFGSGNSLPPLVAGFMTGSKSTIPSETAEFFANCL